MLLTHRIRADRPLSLRHLAHALADHTSLHKGTVYLRFRGRHFLTALGLWNSTSQPHFGAPSSEVSGLPVSVARVTSGVPRKFKFLQMAADNSPRIRCHTLCDSSTSSHSPQKRRARGGCCVERIQTPSSCAPRPLPRTSSPVPACPAMASTLTSACSAVLQRRPKPKPSTLNSPKS